MSALYLAPVSLREANRFVELHHRHHRPPRGCICCVSVVGDDGEVHGVGVAGRPVARMLFDGETAEVTRICTDGTPNACSMLYGALRRACRALGYLRLVTYTLPSEGGASLRGAGYTLIGEAGGGAWSREGRERLDDHPLQTKLRWERVA